ncbi:ADP-ribosylation factor-like protein 6-interacting protein 4 [Malaya genurostris]|uniref:ADP-ribosylation factor-like protein 6-interacting protein 4 n=1 Tax=Malaya genurostris TaxID=325434 RepID=UPI0026F3EFCF|nr:ADP-ribosylation factor-like protein 6-interacting protein 4 [Malaya genurostris]
MLVYVARTSSRLQQLDVILPTTTHWWGKSQLLFIRGRWRFGSCLAGILLKRFLSRTGGSASRWAVSRRWKSRRDSTSSSSDSCSSSSSSGSSSGSSSKSPARKKDKKASKEDSLSRKEKRKIKKLHKKEARRERKAAKEQKKALKKQFKLARKAERQLRKQEKIESKKSKPEPSAPPDPGDDCGVPLQLMDTRARAPETREQYEARQSVIRRVVDPETGRSRLVKGDGEIIEECVSRTRHQDFNRQATAGDGAEFQRRTLGWNVD